MRRMMITIWALTTLMTLTNVTPASAQWINWVQLFAQPEQFRPGIDSIYLNMYADWDTHDDCHSKYGSHCQPLEAFIEFRGTNGYYFNFWDWNVQWGNGSWNAVDSNPGSSAVTYEARLRILYETEYGQQYVYQSGWDTVYPVSPPPPPTNASFYEHIDYQGGSFSAGSDVSFVGWEWNDLISSVRVPAGKTVVLYQDIDFGGASLTLTGDAIDLRAFPGPGPDGTWNDAVSSIRIF